VLSLGARRYPQTSPRAQSPYTAACCETSPCWHQPTTCHKGESSRELRFDLQLLATACNSTPPAVTTHAPVQYRGAIRLRRGVVHRHRRQADWASPLLLVLEGRMTRSASSAAREGPFIDIAHLRRCLSRPSPARQCVRFRVWERGIVGRKEIALPNPRRGAWLASQAISYSMISLVRAINQRGMVSWSAFALMRLRTKSNFRGNTTRGSSGLAP
jgi:hypothetical protein